MSTSGPSRNPATNSPAIPGKSKPRKICVVEFCPSVESHGINLVNVPKEDREKILYVSTSIQYSEKTKLFICEKHFDPTDFYKLYNGKLRLIKGSFPTKGINEERADEIFSSKYSSSIFFFQCSFSILSIFEFQ
jgi:hypothetical protein